MLGEVIQLFMSSQLRVILVFLGAVLVVATYTFPLWQPYLGVLPGRGDNAFLGLPAELSEQLVQLPQSQLDALRELAEEMPEQARQIAIAQLTPGGFIDEPEPEELGQRRSILGDIVPGQPTVQASGTLTIYEIADGSYILRLDELALTNIPDMSLYLSASAAPQNREEMEARGGFHRLQELQGNSGNQNYRIASEIDLSSYSSVVIYSETLDLVIAFATFRIRL